MHDVLAIYGLSQEHEFEWNVGPILMTENPVCFKGSKSVNFLIAQVLLLELTVLAGALC